MLFTFRKLLHHYASATLIDVLHSPFVFGLYNTCIKKNSSVEVHDFIPSGKGYFDRRSRVVLEKYKTFYSDHFFTTDINLIPDGQPFILYLDKLTNPGIIHPLLKTAHNDSVIIVRNMYGSETQLDYWNKLKSAETVTASIDLFFIGFLFVRREQRKQAFRLRLF